MNKCVLILAVALAVSCLCVPTILARAMGADGWSYDSSSIHLDNGDAVIHGNNGAVARITTDGVLFITGQPQKVTPAEQQQLRRYVATVEDLRAKALALAGAAGQFASRIVSDALGGLFSGASEAQIDRTAHEHARDFKRRALPICGDAQTLKHIQDSLAASLPAFRPYAVIEGRDVEDCEQHLDE